MFEHHDFEKNAFEYLTSDVYIFYIFAKFGPKFSGNIHDISNTKNMEKTILVLENKNYNFYFAFINEKCSRGI